MVGDVTIIMLVNIGRRGTTQPTMNGEPENECGKLKRECERKDARVHNARSRGQCVGVQKVKDAEEKKRHENLCILHRNFWNARCKG
jgi:hypothetical protein